MKKRIGRPKLLKSEAKGQQYAVRVLKADAQIINAAIKASGLKKPEWLRKALITAAGGVTE